MKTKVFNASPHQSRFQHPIREKLFHEKSACAYQNSVYYLQNNVSYVKQNLWNESEFMREQGELKVSKASREEVEKLLNQGVYLEIDYLTFSAKY